MHVCSPEARHYTRKSEKSLRESVLSCLVIWTWWQLPSLYTLGHFWEIFFFFFLNDLLFGFINPSWPPPSSWLPVRCLAPPPFSWHGCGCACPPVRRSSLSPTAIAASHTPTRAQRSTLPTLFLMNLGARLSFDTLSNAMAHRS